MTGCFSEMEPTLLPRKTGPKKGKQKSSITKQTLYSGLLSRVNTLTDHGHLTSSLIFITFTAYRKMPKISPGAYINEKPFSRGLYTEGNLRFEIDWASLIVGSKFTIFALFYFVIWGQFSKYKPPEGLYLEGRFNRGFFCVTGLGGLYLEGLIHGEAYFRNFMVCWKEFKLFILPLHFPCSPVSTFPQQDSTNVACVAGGIVWLRD